MKKPGLHISVNPTVSDLVRLGDTGIRTEIGKLMKYLGYGNQPYLVYKHADLERVHFHIVSTRIDCVIRKKIIVSENKTANLGNRMFLCTLPAYGIYVHQFRNIYLDKIEFHLLQLDARQALVFDDAEDLTLTAFRTDLFTGLEQTKKKHSSVKIMK